MQQRKWSPAGNVGGVDVWMWLSYIELCFLCHYKSKGYGEMVQRDTHPGVITFINTPSRLPWIGIPNASNCIRVKWHSAKIWTTLTVLYIINIPMKEVICFPLCNFPANLMECATLFISYLMATMFCWQDRTEPYVWQ